MADTEAVKGDAKEEIKSTEAEAVKEDVKEEIKSTEANGVKEEEKESTDDTPDPNLNTKIRRQMEVRIQFPKLINLLLVLCEWMGGLNLPSKILLNHINSLHYRLKESDEHIFNLCICLIFPVRVVFFIKTCTLFITISS